MSAELTLNDWSLAYADLGADHTQTSGLPETSRILNFAETLQNVENTNSTVVGASEAGTIHDAYANINEFSSEKEIAALFDHLNGYRFFISVLMDDELGANPKGFFNNDGPSSELTSAG